MTDMLTKMARAISHRAGYTEYGPVIPDGIIMDLARAALMAIRDASDDMIDAGVEAAFGECYPRSMRQIHAAMIDHILKEGK